MGVCIGDSNQLAYFEFVGCTTDILFTHVAALINILTPEASGPIFKTIAFAKQVVAGERLWILFLILVAMVMVLELTDSIFTMAFSVARGITCNEFNNAWMHKHLFRVRTTTDRNGVSHDRYTYREMPLGRMFKNLGNFCIARPIVQLEEYGHRPAQ
jgi:hypothetical protein